MELNFVHYWHDLGWPLVRLLAGLSVGLLVATILEATGWLRVLGRLAMPLCRAANLPALASSSLAVAFVSPSTANAILAEGLEQGQLSRKELIFANLLCGLPSYFAHLPTMFLLIYPVLGAATFSYAGVTLAAALMRTGAIVFGARLWRGKSASALSTGQYNPPASNFKRSVQKSFERFKKRMIRLACYTVPMYIAVYLATKYGLFADAQAWLGAHLTWLKILQPEALGIVILQMVAEMGATLGAAGAMLNDGGLTANEIVIAMLTGNILATPLRALRHQFPAYAGFYRASLALKLVLVNQGLRALSMIIALTAFLAVRDF